MATVPSANLVVKSQVSANIGKPTMRPNRECFLTTVELAFKGSRNKQRELRQHNGMEAYVSLPEPVFDKILSGIVKSMKAAVERADARGSGERPTLLSLLAGHPEWTKLSAYKISHHTGYSIDHIKRTMDKPEFQTIRSFV